MIAALGTNIIGQLNTLPFVDKYAGVVKTLTYTTQDANKRSIKKLFPADCKTSLSDCESGTRYLDLCPDDSKKSVMYLEDTGLRLSSRAGHIANFRASYNLVCWLNMPKLGFSDCSYSAIAIASILKKLPTKPFSANPFLLIDIQVVGQQPKTLNPFAKYSYDENVNQFLMYPFDYFVLLLEVNFRIDLRCISITELDPEKTCITK